MANAKSVTVHYGSRSVDWTALQLVPSFANHLPGWIKAEYSKSKSSWQDFAQLLLDTSTSTHASDPRDSVFALFGLAKDCASQGLVADYQLTLPEVSIGAAAFAILNLGDKRILRYAVGRNADGIPTWVPAWGEVRKSPTDEFLQVRAEELLLPAAAAAHPTNCVCDTWEMSLSRDTWEQSRYSRLRFLISDTLICIGYSGIPIQNGEPGGRFSWTILWLSRSTRRTFLQQGDLFFSTDQTAFFTWWKENARANASKSAGVAI